MPNDAPATASLICFMGTLACHCHSASMHAVPTPQNGGLEPARHLQRQWLSGNRGDSLAPVSLSRVIQHSTQWKVFEVFFGLGLCCCSTD
eukprot:354346-Chlamydomonas_euryale.AAC.5